MGATSAILILLLKLSSIGIMIGGQHWELRRKCAPANCVRCQTRTSLAVLAMSYPRVVGIIVCMSCDPLLPAQIIKCTSLYPTP